MKGIGIVLGGKFPIGNHTRSLRGSGVRIQPSLETGHLPLWTKSGFVSKDEREKGLGGNQQNLTT